MSSEAEKALRTMKESLRKGMETMPGTTAKEAHAKAQKMLEQERIDTLNAFDALQLPIAPPNWLEAMYRYVELGEIKSALSIFFYEIGKFAKAKDFEQCDKVLQCIDFRRLCATSTALVLDVLRVLEKMNADLKSMFMLRECIRCRLMQLIPEITDDLMSMQLKQGKAAYEFYRVWSKRS